MGKIGGFLLSIIVAVVALRVWGAMNPSHYTWGFQTFAYYPLTWALAALLIVLLILIPTVRKDILAQLSKFTGWAASLPAASIVLGLLAIWIGIMIFFPVKLHLLGDSEIILQLTPDRPSIADASANFRNQPLTHEILLLLQWASGGGGAVEPITLYRIADGISGVAFIGLIFFLLRSLAKTGINRLDIFLIGIVLLFRAGTQFFFGYVENYMFFYVALTAFIVTGWLSLEKLLPVWIPILMLLLVPGFHLVGVIFLPAGLLLLTPYWKEHRRYFLAVGGALLAAAVLFVIALGPSWVLTRVTDAGTYDILPVFTPPGGIPYGILSKAHLIDWANANLHIAPFGILCVVAGMVFIRRNEYLGSPVFRFLALAAVIGLTMSFIALPGLGMARDWDMWSNFFIPLRFLMVYFLILFLRDKGARGAVLAMGVVTLIHWFAWIGINANEDRHLARAEVLTVPELSGTFPTLYYEHLGETFFEKKRYRNAVKWYEEYLKIDSTHPRILANLSECYRELGDKENVFRMLRLSVDANSINPGVYSNLAVEYVTRGDTGRAITLLNKAVKLDPGMAIAWANLCLLNMKREHYEEARQNAATAIRLGMHEPVLLKQAGYASYFLKDYSSAILSLNEYLKSAPADETAKELFNELKTILGKNNPLKKAADNK